MIYSLINQLTFVFSRCYHQQEGRHFHRCEDMSADDFIELLDSGAGKLGMIYVATNLRSRQGGCSIVFDDAVLGCR